MAGLIQRTAPFALSFSLAAAVSLAAAGGTLVAGAEPGGTPPPPSCAERYPDAGPAGVDLRLGCIVGELIGLYTAGESAAPAPLSTYVILLAVAIGAGLAALWLTGRLVARRAGARLAPVVPAEWWVCERCRSVNGAAAPRCYACGGPRSAGPALSTEQEPSTPQSFGRGKHE